MSLETWLAFVATSAAPPVIAGPTVPPVVSRAIGRGWRVAAPMAAAFGRRVA